MTVIFQNKHTDKIAKVEDVKYLTTDEIVHGVTGFGVSYLDGTYNLYNKESWTLRSVLL